MTSPEYAQSNSGALVAMGYDADQKSWLDRSPKLSSLGLTILLVLMCAVPTLTVYTLHRLMPKVYQGKLDAEIRLLNVPPDSYYKIPMDERPEIESASIVVENNGDIDWSNFHVRINQYYQIYDVEPIPAGTSRTYLLDRFIAKIGAELDIRFVHVDSVEIYARVNKNSRYTYEKEF